MTRPGKEWHYKNNIEPCMYRKIKAVMESAKNMKYTKKNKIIIDRKRHGLSVLTTVYRLLGAP
jgi:hypothetical protein